GTVEKCLQDFNSSTAQPDVFLNVQDDLAANFTSLTKSLYDFHKSYELKEWKGSLLEQLVVENFDEEQIWQELELQNEAALAHFEKEVSSAVADHTLTLLEESEQEEDEDGEEDQEEVDEEEEDYEGDQRKNGLSDEEEEEDEEELDDEDSDIDFDVDKLEKQSKLKKKVETTRPKLRPVSEVDDQFFKLSDMEAFLDDMDKREGKKPVEEEIDYFQDLPSDEDETLGFDKPAAPKRKMKSSRNVKYKDYFIDEDPVRHEEDDEEEEEEDQEDVRHEEEDEEEEEEEDQEDDDEDEDSQEGDAENTDARHAKNASRKVTFDLPSESEGEDVEEILGGKNKNVTTPKGSKSSFEKRQEKMMEKISELEKAALVEKPWQLTGEVTAQSRPENSMLEEDVDYDQSSRAAPAVTEETTLRLEEIIIQRIKDQAWDDVVRKEKPKEEAFEYKKRLTLDHEKSKLSLAEVYEQEYIKQNQEKTEEENPAHVEIQNFMDSLFLKLDALSNFHFTPKPHIPEVKIISNLPSITMEEVAPVSVSDATLLAPEEVKEKNKAGHALGDSEKTSTDKKRERRKKKKLKRLKIQEREKNKKLKEAASEGKSKKTSKAHVEETLRKLTKGGKAKVLTDDGMDKALRSSQAFFSQLQDQVRSQIKGSKDQAAKKKKQKEISANKLKL
ncbi:U3 small nucleolar ribonucleoprotein MPP10, partial [Silurus asotus]